MKYASVTEVVRRIKDDLQSDYRLQSIAMEGSIIGLKRASNGHYYMNLHDETCSIRAILFRSRVGHSMDGVREGDQVVVIGSINVYEKGDKAYNATYNEHLVNLNLLDFNVRNFNFNIGARFDYFNIHSLLAQVTSEQPTATLKSDHFISYHANVTYNSEDKWNFPTRGARFEGGFAYYTDDLARYLDHKGFSSLSAMWRMNFTFSERMTIQPMAYGRLLFGSDIPVEKQNMIGGETFNRYLDDQMPFPGMGFVEHTDNQFVAIQLRAQLRILENNYVRATVTAAQHAQRLRQMLQHGPMTGYQLAYFYNSMFGPLGATLGYASKTRNPYFYINLGYEF